jgi:hypothetical protein
MSQLELKCLVHLDSRLLVHEFCLGPLHCTRFPKYVFHAADGVCAASTHPHIDTLRGGQAVAAKLADVRAAFELLKADADENTATFLSGLFDMCKHGKAVRGQVGLTGHLVKKVLFHFHHTHLKELFQDQLRFVREHCGQKLSNDHTFHGAKTLAARNLKACTKHGRVVSAPMQARVLTVCVEHGLVAAAVLVPDCTHEHLHAVIIALSGGDPTAGLQPGSQKYMSVRFQDVVNRDCECCIVASHANMR